MSGIDQRSSASRLRAYAPMSSATLAHDADDDCCAVGASAPALRNEWKANSDRTAAAAAGTREAADTRARCAHWGSRTDRVARADSEGSLAPTVMRDTRSGRRSLLAGVLK